MIKHLTFASPDPLEYDAKVGDFSYMFTTMFTTWSDKFRTDDQVSLFLRPF